MNGGGGGGGDYGGGGSGGGGTGGPDYRPPGDQPPVDPCPIAFSARLVDSAQVMPSPQPDIPADSVLALVDEGEVILVTYRGISLGYLPGPSVARIKFCTSRGVVYVATFDTYVDSGTKVEITLRRS